MKKAFIWNMLGTIMSAGASMLLLIITTRVCGATEAGIFSVAWVTAQMLMVIGNYGVRAYQVTDIQEKYCFSEYLVNRILTCLIMLVVSFLFCKFKRYDTYKSLIVILTCIYRILDALADVYEGRMQQRGRMDLAGQSLFFRNLSSTTAFVITLFCSKQIIYSLVVAILVGIVGFIVNCLLRYKETILWHSREIVIKACSLLYTCFPLFGASFITAYLVNAPKYAIDTYMTSSYQTYYNILSLPAQIIYLTSNFILKPILKDLAEYWNRENQSKFSRYILSISAIIVGFTIVTATVGRMVGIPILSFIYKVDMRLYTLPLVIILIAGGLNALSNLLYYALTVMRVQSKIIKIYGATSILSIIISPISVRVGGILGATIGYLIIMTILNLLMGSLVILEIYYSKRYKDAVSSN